MWLNDYAKFDKVDQDPCGMLATATIVEHFYYTAIPAYFESSVTIDL